MAHLRGQHEVDVQDVLLYLENVWDMHLEQDAKTFSPAEGAPLVHPKHKREHKDRLKRVREQKAALAQGKPAVKPE